MFSWRGARSNWPNSSPRPVSGSCDESAAGQRVHRGRRFAQGRQDRSP
jgi:hypothetical protein